MKMGVNADKETVLALAWEVTLEWLLDTGEGLDGEGDPDERELASRKAEVYERLGTAWDVAKDEYYEAAMEQFIKENREGLVAIILGHIAFPDAEPFEVSDDEIEQWVNNDEGLYAWAREEGAVE